MRLSTIASYGFGLSLSLTAALAQTNVASYIATESPIAKAGLLANIGPKGSKASGAKVCSPGWLLACSQY